MGLADLAKLGVRKLVVDVDEHARTVIVRRLLLKFLLTQGFRQTSQAQLSEPDAKDGWISAKHDVHGRLHIKPRALVVDAHGAELAFDLEDDSERAKTDAAKACATAAAGALLLLFTGGTFGKGVVMRGAMGAARAGSRITEATTYAGVGASQRTRVDVDVGQIAVLKALLARHGGSVVLVCHGKGSDLVVGGGELTLDDVREVVRGLEAQAKSLIK
jgi:hypothetical protein